MTVLVALLQSVKHLAFWTSRVLLSPHYYYLLTHDGALLAAPASTSTRQRKQRGVAMEELTSAMSSSRIVSHQRGDEVYHETQRRMWCALHALNALLQEPAYDAAALTEIALSIGGKLQLAHRWPLMGNWDINVMMIALQQRGLEVQWWDQRRSIDALQRLAEGTDCVGLICNEPGAWLFARLVTYLPHAVRALREAHGSSGWYRASTGSPSGACVENGMISTRSCNGPPLCGRARSSVACSGYSGARPARCSW